MDDNVKISPNTVRLYFAQKSTMDKGFFESWKNTYLNESVKWLTFDGHDTLKHLIFSSQFDSLGHWLAGTNSSYDETA